MMVLKMVGVPMGLSLSALLPAQPLVYGVPVIGIPGTYCQVASVCFCLASAVYTGKDATQDFEEIGHSNSARELLEKYLVGSYAVS